MKKIKLFFATMLTAVMVVVGMPINIFQNITTVNAITLGDYRYEVLNDGTIKITGYEEIDNPDIIGISWANIPSEIHGKNVTCIGVGAFRDCKIVTMIDVPEGVTTVESYAFAGTWAGINVPSTIKSIGSWAFSGCSGQICNDLDTFKIPLGITKIEEGTFNECTGLKKVIIPNGVTSIGNQAFNGCNTLNSVTIPKTIKSIGEKAFYNCKELTNIKISTNVIVGKDAFAGCDKLKIEYETETPIAVKPTMISPTTAKPKITKLGKTLILKARRSGKKVKISLKKVVNAKNYQIKFSTGKKFKAKSTNTVTTKNVKYTYKKLKKKIKYYVKARAYGTYSGKNIYGKWSKIKVVKVKS